MGKLDTEVVIDSSIIWTEQAIAWNVIIIISVALNGRCHLAMHPKVSFLTVNSLRIFYLCFLCIFKWLLSHPLESVICLWFSSFLYLRDYAKGSSGHRLCFGCSMCMAAGYNGFFCLCNFKSLYIFLVTQLYTIINDLICVIWINCILVLNHLLCICLTVQKQLFISFESSCILEN